MNVLLQINMTQSTKLSFSLWMRREPYYQEKLKETIFLSLEHRERKRDTHRENEWNQWVSEWVCMYEYMKESARKLNKCSYTHTNTHTLVYAHLGNISLFHFHVRECAQRYACMFFTTTYKTYIPRTKQQQKKRSDFKHWLKCMKGTRWIEAGVTKKTSIQANIYTHTHIHIQARTYTNAQAHGKMQTREKQSHTNTYTTPSHTVVDQ